MHTQTKWEIDSLFITSINDDHQGIDLKEIEMVLVTTPHHIRHIDEDIVEVSTINQTYRLLKSQFNKIKGVFA